MTIIRNPNFGAGADPLVDLEVDDAIFGGLAATDYLVLPKTDVSPISASEADVRFDDQSTRAIYVGDGADARPVTPISYLPYAVMMGASNGDTFSTAINLEVVAAGNGGAILVPIFLPAPMLLQSCSVWNTDTSLARTGEWRLFYQKLQASTTFAEVPNANGTWSFTPGAASRVSSNAQLLPTLIAPGLYWLGIRNTHATVGRTFGVGVDANAGSVAFGTLIRKDATQAAFTTTIALADFAASTGRTAGVMLNGRVGGESAAYA